MKIIHVSIFILLYLIPISSLLGLFREYIYLDIAIILFSCFVIIITFTKKINWLFKMLIFITLLYLSLVVIELGRDKEQEKVMLNEFINE